jgi:hypothetical protein
MRERTGKRARLSSVEFDREAVNAVVNKTAEAEEAAIKEEQKESHEHDAEVKEAEKASQTANEPKAEKSEADKLEAQPVEKADAKGPNQEKNKEK